MNKSKKTNILNTTLWVCQILLAAMFIMTGIMKISQPITSLAESLPWVNDTPLELVRFIGLSEFLGAIGLVLPSIVRIKPFLTIWASLGLAIIMLLALIFHGSRGEFEAIVANITFMSIALFIAWGRSKKAIILPK